MAYSTWEMFPFFTINMDSSESQLLLSDHLRKHCSKRGCLSESPICWSRLFSTGREGFCPPKKRYFHKQVASRPAGHDSPESDSCSAECSVHCATYYPHAEDICGQRKQTLAELPLLPSQTVLSATSFMQNFSAHESERSR